MNANKFSKPFVYRGGSTSSKNMFWRAESVTADFTPSRVGYFGETWLLLGSYGVRMVEKGQDDGPTDG